MADNLIQIDIDDANLNRLLKELRKKGEDFSPVTKEIANYLYLISDETFDNESAFDGTPWDRLADSTVKAKGHDRKLYDDGDMRDSLSEDSDGGKAIVGLNVISDDGYPYAVVHQFGTDDERVPARPFLPFDEENQLYEGAKDEIIDLVRDFLEDI